MPGAEILPVDSEHCALHQCLRAGRAREVAKLVLTASGGPFRGRSRAELAEVTVEGALAHPTWQMGPKITVDSSTLMNKGLEVIEAHELYGTPYDRHRGGRPPPVGGALHGDLHRRGHHRPALDAPTCASPISYALAYPQRSTWSPSAPSTGPSVGSLDFEAARPRRLSVPRPGLRRRAAAAGRSRRGSTRPTRWPSTPSCQVGCPGVSIPDVLNECLDRHDGDGDGRCRASSSRSICRARELARAGSVERRAAIVTDTVEQSDSAGATSSRWVPGEPPLGNEAIGVELGAPRHGGARHAGHRRARLVHHARHHRRP